MSLLLSPLVRSLAIAGVLVASFLTWLAVHDARVESRAVSGVVNTIKERADANAQTADRVRDAVADGKRGVRNPHRRND